MEAFGFVPEHHITVTRGRVFEDALRELGPAALKADARAARRESGPEASRVAPRDDSRSVSQRTRR